MGRHVGPEREQNSVVTIPRSGRRKCIFYLARFDAASGGRAAKEARSNHVGAAIARHKRAGRIEEREGKLYATRSAETEQRAAV